MARKRVMCLIVTVGLILLEIADSFSPKPISGPYGDSMRNVLAISSYLKAPINGGIRMSPQDYENQSRTSKQINFLLTKAVDLINKMTSNKKVPNGPEGTDVEVMTAKKAQSRVPVSLSFSSTHKHSMSLNDPAAAHDYLSLPVEAYSVLDSKLVARSLLSDDAFVLSLPLGDLSSAASMATGGGNGIKLAATLRTEVTVRPDPAKGRVVMESGPIYFTPTKTFPKSVNNLSGNAVSTPSTGTSANNSPTEAPTEVEITGGFSDALPEWLLWGGRATTPSDEKSDQTNVIEHDGEPVDENQNSCGKADATNTVDMEVVKSSVQARFRIELQWKSYKVSELNENGMSGLLSRANDMRRSLFSKDVSSATNPLPRNPDGAIPITKNDSDSDVFEDVMSEDPGTETTSSTASTDVTGGSDSGKASGQADETVIEEEISLPVNAVVKVWVDVNLPVRGDLASALTFPPIKILLNQAGALTTKAVLGTLAPVLGKLLVRDYDLRRKTNTTDAASNNEAAVSTSIAFKKPENLYDDLTADIEIK